MSEFIWVDAICIDQKNDDEKAHQVQMMGDIFRNAVQVLIWLGESTDSSEEGMKVIILLIKERDRWHRLGAAARIAADTCVDAFVETQGSPTTSREIRTVLHVSGESYNITTLQDVVDFCVRRIYLRLDALSRTPDKRLIGEGILGILSRPWFERVWVIQECVLARKAWVVCGKDMLQFRYFEALRTILSSIFKMLGSEGNSYWLNTWLITHLSRMVSRTRTVLTPWQQKRYYLLTMLRTIHSETNKMKATDPRDRIYGLFSLNPRATELNIPVDYKIS